MTTATEYEPVINTRWEDTQGDHAGSLVQIIRMTERAVVVKKIRGGSVSMSQKARSHGGHHNIDRDLFLSRYRPATERDKRVCRKDVVDALMKAARWQHALDPAKTALTFEVTHPEEKPAMPT